MFVVLLMTLVFAAVALNEDVSIPTAPQVWYQQAEIHALIHFNMATFFEDGDPGCTERNWNESSQVSSFNPKLLNTSQWADVMVDLGAKGAILTAKHGCGFLLWPSESKLPNGTRYPYRVDRDVLAMFQKSMEERGIGHGFYYSLTNNFFLNVRTHVAGTAAVPPLAKQVNVSQSEFESIALQQVTELWTKYGNLSEIWFDGGYTSDMKKSLSSLLLNQPNAIGFGGDGISANPSDWIGTESGSPSCPDGIWYTNGYGCGNLSVPSNYTPKTCDTTLQNGDHWFWSTNATDIRTLNELIDVYHNSVGNGCTMELDFAIDRDGLVNKVHADRYREFGNWIRKCYSSPYDATITSHDLHDGNYVYDVTFKKPVLIDRVSIREDIRYGQRVRSFVLSSSYELTSGTSIGNRRIKLLSEAVTVNSLRLSVSAVDVPKFSQIAFFAPCDE